MPRSRPCTFPRLDGSGKTAGDLTVALRPESTVSAAASGSFNPSATKLKAWTTSNFVVDIPGVDCSQVSSVAATDGVAGRRRGRRGPGAHPARAAGPLRSATSCSPSR